MNLTGMAMALFAVLLSLFVLIGLQLFRFESEGYRQREIEQVKQQLDERAAALKARIYANIYAVSGVKSLVAMNPDLTQDDFSRAMAVQFREKPDLRNVGLARDMIIRFMYPLEGNEAAVGLDYRKQPDQIEAVRLALRLNKIVLAGPVSLVQGGEGLIARIPIHVADPASGKERFWGFASVVMDMESIFAGAGIMANDGELRISLKGRDARGPDGDVFFGDPSVFERDPVTQTIELPDGSWQLAAIPAHGWSRYPVLIAPLMSVYLAVVSAILIFAAVIVFLLVKTRKASDALKKERDLFADGPVFTIEWRSEPQDRWSVTYVSTNVAQILGYRAADLLNADFSYSSLIHPDDLSRILAELQNNIEAGTDRFEASYRLRTGNGHFVWLYDFTILVRDQAGRVAGMRSYLYDQSAQKYAEEALRLAEARLEKTAYELTENIPIGTYTMVQPADGGMAKFAFMSSRFLELTGLSRAEAAADTLRAFACVHPDDYDDWVALNAKAFAEKAPFFGETRVLVDGQVRWVTAESFPRTLADGTTVWEGILADITDRKRAEEALTESLRRFNDLVEHVSVGVYVFWHRGDGRSDFEYVSDGWCAMNQIAREAVLADPKVAVDVIHPEDLAEFKRCNQQAIEDKSQFRWEGRVIVGGVVSHMLIESSPLFFDNSDSRWFGIQQDISERKKAEAGLREANDALETEIRERISVEEELKIKTELLEKLSRQDVLTEIPNRRHFNERAKLEWQRAQRVGLPLSLLMIDIDLFKQYNDHYGHAAGDACLKQVAQALKACVERPLDLVARYGGEEFVALLPETDRSGACHLAEQMRAAVEALSIPHAGSSIANVVTLSVGVATHKDGKAKANLSQLHACADQALYRAKHQGRNRVELEATPPEQQTSV
jgi:diguanylate cyclase (GGDEF)-like protein/PAS domain S-box-containing protein